MTTRSRYTVTFRNRHDPTSASGAGVHAGSEHDHQQSRAAGPHDHQQPRGAGAHGQRLRMEPGTHGEATLSSRASAGEAQGCFAYEQTDIPPDVTLRQWRRSQAPPPSLWVRVHSRLRPWRGRGARGL